MFKKTRKLSLRKITEAMIMAAVMSSSVYGYAAPVDVNLELPKGETNKVGIDSITRVDRNGNVLDQNSQLNNKNNPNEAIMNIVQDAGTNVARIDWQSFNIGSKATVNVKQMVATQTLINNVVGNKMSEIYGKFNASGNIVLINPKGVVFGGNSEVNVGGLAVYATDVNIDGGSVSVNPNNILQGNITVEGNAKIHAGIGYAISQLRNLGINDDSKYMLGTVAGTGNNKLRLVAAGNINIKDNPELIAVGSVINDGEQDVGVEEIRLFNQSTHNGSGIFLRSDADADDFGKVSINGAKVGGHMDIYSNPEFATGDYRFGERNGVEYNKKDYTNFENTFEYSTVETVNDTSWKGARNETLAEARTKGSPDFIENKTKAGSASDTAYMLVNNIAQLQDIEDGDYGNLSGKYALGRTVSGTSDGTSVIKNGVIYVQNGSQTIIKSADENSVFVDDKGKVTGKKDDIAGKVVTINGNDYNVAIKPNEEDKTVTSSTVRTDTEKNVTVNYSVDDKGTSANSVVVEGSIGDYTVDLQEKSIDGYTVDEAKQTISNNDVSAKFGETTSTITENNKTYTISENAVTDNTYTLTGTSIVTKKDETYSVNTSTNTLTDGTGANANTYKTTGENNVKINNVNYTYNGSSVANGEYSSNATVISKGEYTYNSEVFKKGQDEVVVSADEVKIGTTEYITFTKDSINYIKVGNATDGYQEYNVEDGGLGTAAKGIFDEAQNVTSGLEDNYAKFTNAFTMSETYANKYNEYNSQRSALATANTDFTAAKTAYDAYDAFNTFANNTEGVSVKEALVNATSQYMQITDTSGTKVKLGTFNASAWDSGKGFNPIGGTNGVGTAGYGSDASADKYKDEVTTDSFNGEFTGYNGLGTADVTQLVIKRAAEDNVGLFSTVTNTGSIHNVGVDGTFEGHKNVGVVAGNLKGSVGGVNSGGSVKGVENVGGLVGKAGLGTTRAQISNSSNSANISGNKANDYYKDKSGQDPAKSHTSASKTGGIAGYAENAIFTNVHNSAPVVGENQVGGLVGQIDKGGISGTDEFALTYNNSTVTGKEDVGGIAGLVNGAKPGDVTISKVFNTNESSILAGTSQKWVDNNGSWTEQSIYGKVEGTKDVGGIVGHNVNGNISTVYNAGNVSGKAKVDSTNVGGIVGHLESGSIEHAYNADNNSVMREKLPQSIDELLSKAGAGGTPYKFVGEGRTGETEYIYQPLQDGKTNQTEYNSFYTVDSKGNKTYYYFIPEAGELKQGAPGVFVTVTGGKVDEKVYVFNDELPAESSRVYFNRLAYKDANVTGTNNVGGLVGQYEAGTIKNSYNAGTVTATGTATDQNPINKGALIGDVNADTNIAEKITDTFFVTGKVPGNGDKAFSGVDSAFGNHTLTNGGTTTNGVKKYKDGTAGTAIYSGNFNTMSNGKALGDLGSSWVNSTSSQNNTWITYEQSTLPLLKEFLMEETLTREFTYDGSTHNLTTIDINHLYGLSSFNNYYAGRDVFAGEKPISGYDWEEKDGYKQSIYTYDSSTMWSPQHAFMTRSDANVRINPAKMDITVNGERVYGQHHLEGYYVYAPGQSNYRELEAKNSGEIYNHTLDDKFYVINGNDYTDIQTDISVNEEKLVAAAVITGQGKTYSEIAAAINALSGEAKTAAEKEFADIKAIKGALEDLGYGSFDAKTVADIKTAANSLFKPDASGQKLQGNVTTDVYKSGTYLVTVKGLVNTREHVDSVLTGLISNTKIDGATGNSFYDSNDATMDLGAGSKKLADKESYEGIGNVHRVPETDDVDTYNYSFTYNRNNNNTLKINKADLLYTYEGVKTYGDSNNMGVSGNIKIVGVDDSTADASANGLLKDFDSSKIGSDLTIDKKGLLQNTNNKVLAVIDGVEIVDNETIKPYTVVENGVSYTYYTLVGKVDDEDVTKTIKVNNTNGDVKGDGKAWAQWVKNPDGNTNVVDRIYHVKGTKENPETYQVLWTNTFQKDQSKSSLTSDLKNNYNFVFAGEGTHTLSTTYKGKTESSVVHTDKTPSYLQNSTTVATESTQKILPKNLEVTFVGTREYGSLMGTDSYDIRIDVNNLNKGVWDVTYGVGNTENKKLTTWDQLNGTEIKKVIAADAIESTDITSTDQISKKTHVGTYDLRNSTTYPDSNINISNARDEEGQYIGDNILYAINSEDYNVSNGAHKLTITQKRLDIDITGEKTYGELTTNSGLSGHTVAVVDGVIQNPVNKYYTYEISGLFEGEEVEDADGNKTVIGQELIGGLGNGANQTSNTIILNTGNLATDENYQGKTLAANSDGYTDQLTVNFETTTTTDFSASDYDIHYTSNLKVDKRPVTIDTAATRDYGDVVNGKNNNTYVYTGSKEDISAVTGIITENNSNIFKDSTLGVIKDELLNTVDNSSASLDVKRVDGEVSAYQNDVFTNKLTTSAVEGTALDNNYVVVKGSQALTVNPVDLTIHIEGRKEYGQVTDVAASDTRYKYTITGLRNNEKIGGADEGIGNVEKKQGIDKFNLNTGDSDEALKLKDTDSPNYDRGIYLDAGEYDGNGTYDNGFIIPDDANNKLIYIKNLAQTGANGLTVTDNENSETEGFNANNYNITMTSKYVVDKKGTNTDGLIINIQGEKTYGEITANGTAASEYGIGKGQSGHQTVVDENGTVTTSAANYKYTISGLVGNETIGGLGNVENSTSQSIVLNTGALATTENNNGRTLAAGNHADELTINFANDSGTVVGNSFKTSNYTDITYSSNLKVDKRPVTVDTDVTRDYGDVVDGKNNNTYVYTGSKEDTATVTGIIAENNSNIFENSTLGVIKDGLLNTVDNSSASLDVKRDATNRNNILAYQNNVFTDKLTTSAVEGTVLDNNYIVVKGNQSIKVNPVALTIKIEGEKTYGETIGALGNFAGNNTQTAGAKPTNPYKVTAEGLVLGEKIDGIGENQAAGTANLQMDTSAIRAEDDTDGSKMHVGTYGTNPSGAGIQGEIKIDNIASDTLSIGKDTATAETVGFNENNYDITYNTVYKINAADLTIKMSGSKTYGEVTSTDGTEYHVDQVTGLKNGQTITGYNGAITGNGALASDQIANAGVYVGNVAADGTASSNYTQHNTQAGFTDAGYFAVDDATKFIKTGDFDPTDYNISYVNTFTVNKKAVSMTNTGERVYGPTQSTITINQSISGLLEKDDAWKNGEGIVSSADITEAYKDAGTYTDSYAYSGTNPNADNTNQQTSVFSHTVAGDNFNQFDNNYLITKIDDTLKITPKRIIVRVTGERVYGDPTLKTDTDYKFEVLNEDRTQPGLENGEHLGNFETLQEMQKAFEVTTPNDVKDEDGDVIGGAGDIYVDANEKPYEDVFKIGNIGDYDVKDTSSQATKGFNSANYEIVAWDTSLKINKRPMVIVIDRTQVQGQEISHNPGDYNINPKPVIDPETGVPKPSTGIADGENLNNLGGTTVEVNGNPSEIGKYEYEGKGGTDGKGTYTDPSGISSETDSYISGLKFDENLDKPYSRFKPSNYDISYDTVLEILPPYDPTRDLASAGANRRGMYSIQYLTITGNGVVADSLTSSAVNTSEAQTPVVAASVVENASAPAVETATSTTNLNEALANDTTGAYSADAQEDEDKKNEKK